MSSAALLNTLLALSPVLVSLAARSGGADEATFRLAYLFLGLPLVSAIANQWHCRRGSATAPPARTRPRYFKLGLLAGPVVGYGVWGIATGHLLSPDTETIALTTVNVIVSYVLGSFSFALISQWRH